MQVTEFLESQGWLGFAQKIVSALFLAMIQSSRCTETEIASLEALINTSFGRDAKLFS